MLASSFARRLGRLVLAAALTAPLIACVSTQVKSSVVGAPHQPVARVIVLASPGNFAKENIAGSLGQRNLDRLAPSLQARLPADLTQGGLKARWWSDGSTQASDEKVLTLTPVSASYNSRTGQKLVLRAALAERLYQPPFWTAEITLSTLTFAQWGDGLADDIASQLIERLRADRLLGDAPK